MSRPADHLGAEFGDMWAAVRMHRPRGAAWTRSTLAVDRYRRAVLALWQVRRAVRGGLASPYAEALVSLDRCLAELEAAALDAALARGDAVAAANHAARRRHFDAWADARAAWIDGPALRLGRQTAASRSAGGRAPKSGNMRDQVLALARQYSEREPHLVAGLIAQRLGVTSRTVRRHLLEARKTDSK